jgi:hypothetical protein
VTVRARDRRVAELAALVGLRTDGCIRWPLDELLQARGGESVRRWDHRLR